MVLHLENVLRGRLRRPRAAKGSPRGDLAPPFLTSLPAPLASRVLAHRKDAHEPGQLSELVEAVAVVPVQVEASGLTPMLHVSPILRLLAVSESDC